MLAGDRFGWRIGLRVCVCVITTSCDGVNGEVRWPAVWVRKPGVS